MQRIQQIFPPVNTAEMLFHGTCANLGMPLTATFFWAWQGTWSRPKALFYFTALALQCFVTSTQKFWDGSDNVHLAATEFLYPRTIRALEKPPSQDPPGVTGERKWAMEQNSKGHPLHFHFFTRSWSEYDSLPLLQLSSDTWLKTCSRLCRQPLQLALLQYV